MRLRTFCFCLILHPPISASIDGSCLWQLPLWFSTSLVPSAFITWDFSIRKSSIFFPIYLQLCGLTGTYCILWVRIQCYCDLSFCATSSNLGHWELFWVDSCAFLICPYPFFLFSSCPSFLLKRSLLAPTHEYNMWLHMGSESNSSLSEDGPRASGGQDYLLLHNVPTLGLAKNTRRTQNQGFSWFPCPLSPLPSQFLGHQKSGFLSQSNFLSRGMSD